MGYRGRKEFIETGLKVLVLGFALCIVGFISLRSSWISSTYTGDIYWNMTLNIVGSGLILTGIILAIIGSLRDS